ncbi:lipase/ esterase [Punctularia strigosozonata HHB-11173 SS5]|uniref:lipase/ esterase n=1 Tax=Punctularia strigosozonata (strain HHB-11173) TaxID=741275 RepID=UPI0004417B4F|nr:lipase/ esterase [Punctularia strigosozonata HHB-11173 SS5]EIN13871.1 lipase/ esterase [Punctularia strigosozonata HHB-11173 SS5]
MLSWPFSYSSDADLNNEQLASEQQVAAPRANKSPHDLLHHYKAPGTRPPSARVDPRLKQRERAFKIWDVWKYGALAASKATEVALDLASHSLFGPRRKSWGLEMTLITSFMRNVGKHSHLVDIATVRLLIGLSGLIPTPSDALVTPVTFRVRKRNLRGILQEFDSLEDGSRELYGEWVVGKKLWKRLQADWNATRKAAASPGPAEEANPSPKQAKRKDRVILYLHGGAYYCFSATTHRLITIPLSKWTEARVFAIDYRLAPETRFPGPLHDAVIAYLRLVEDLNIPPENILISGDSAGGGLSLAVLMYLRDNGYPLPGGAILMSPWVDLTMSCDSWDSNADFDVVPRPDPASHLDPIACYLGENMEKYLTHPYASPLFGDFVGLPPMLVQCGDAEVLRDEITLLAHKATLAGVDLQHELYEDAVHVFQAFPFLDVTERAFMACRSWVRHHLPAVQRQAPRPLNVRAENGLENETCNDKTRVVRGDGVEITSDTEIVKEEANDDAHPHHDEDDGHSSQEEEPSWQRVQSPWPSPPPSDGEGDKSSQERYTLRRIHSSASSLMRTDFASSSSKAVMTPPSPRNHRRTPSATLRMTDIRRSGTATLSISSTSSQAPRPAIRRAASSHPDISMLCQSWYSGPANHTTTYRPETASRVPTPAPKHTANREASGSNMF